MVAIYITIYLQGTTDKPTQITTVKTVKPRFTLHQEFDPIGHIFLTLTTLLIFTKYQVGSPYISFRVTNLLVSVISRAFGPK